MLHQYEANVKATISFLRLLNVKVNDTTVNDTLQNHPDWPGLLCISDSLNNWNIPNGAGKIDVNKIDELPHPFMANTYNAEIPIAIVTEITTTTVQSYQKNYNTLITESRENFYKKWYGVYLIAEPDEHFIEPNFKINKRNAVNNSAIPFAAIFLLIIISFLVLQYTAGGNHINSAASFNST